MLFLLRSIHSKLGIPLNASSEIVVMLFPGTEGKEKLSVMKYSLHLRCVILHLENISQK